MTAKILFCSYFVLWIYNGLDKANCPPTLRTQSFVKVGLKVLIVAFVCDVYAMAIGNSYLNSFKAN